MYKGLTTKTMRKHKYLINRMLALVCACTLLIGCGAGTAEVEPAESVETAKSPVVAGGEEQTEVGPEPEGNREAGTMPADGSESESAEASTPNAETEVSQITEPDLPTGQYDFTLCFAGDINFDEGWQTTVHMDQCENGILDCISPELVETMQSADIMWLNNEFTYSDRGQPLSGKAYTFRADPSRVENLALLGVDIVGLANNHVYDYGKDALLDTLDTLEQAEIPYVGAGRNLEEATSPVYLEVDGKTVAFVAASRAEKNKMTPQATETEPGILRCYDPTLFEAEIAEADAKADIVVALPHWGTEYSTELEPVQKETARVYIDAGADVIIGAHTHCLQGFEYYNGVPVVYSLGNYWFNGKTLDTMLINLHCYGNDEEDHMDVYIIPALQKDITTTYVSDPAKQRELYDRLEDISVNVTIEDDGRVTEKPEE